MNIYQKLSEVQSKLKVAKENVNTFGNYKYRSCEDILEAVKPLLKDVGAALTLSDEAVCIGDRHYIKASANFVDTDDCEVREAIGVTAYAREDENKKGMDLCQLTGSTSSYARKYALNGLFAIDDTKDSDATNIGEDKPVREVLTYPTASKMETIELKSYDKVISEAQAKRIFGIAKNGKPKLTDEDKENVKIILAKYGYTDSRAVKWTDYEKICKDIEEINQPEETGLPW
jgi:hypothetical protein